MSAMVLMSGHAVSLAIFLLCLQRVATTVSLGSETKGDGAVGIAMCADEKSSGRAGARFGQYMWAGLQPTRNPNQ